MHLSANGPDRNSAIVRTDPVLLDIELFWVLVASILIAVQDLSRSLRCSTVAAYHRSVLLLLKLEGAKGVVCRVEWVSRRLVRVRCQPPVLCSETNAPDEYIGNRRDFLYSHKSRARLGAENKDDLGQEIWKRNKENFSDGLNSSMPAFLIINHMR
jgi:hypothetical protein